MLVYEDRWVREWFRDLRRRTRNIPYRQFHSLCTFFFQILLESIVYELSRAKLRSTNSPWVCGFLTSISRKLSGTLYISSIWVKKMKSRELVVRNMGRSQHTVCSRAERRDSSNAELRANGDTAAAILVLV